MTKNKAPELRFKGFVDAWEQRKLGDYAEILTGGTPKTSISEYWEPKKVPWMSSGEVNKRRLDGTNNMISEEGLNNSSARWVKKHSVLIALAGQGKTRGTVAVNNIQLTTNQSIAAIVPNDNLHYEFIYQNLFKRYDELRMISSGDGTRGGLNKKIVSDVAIPSPSKEEQTKIGTFFKKIDETIALHQGKLGALKQMKKGFLQQMFPINGEHVPRVRFAHFDKEWELRKLKELATFNPKSNLPDKFEYIDLESVVSTELIGHRAENKSSAPSRAQRLAQKNDVFYQTVRPYQKNNYLFDLPYDNYVFSTGYAQMRPKNSGYFLLTLVQEEKFVNRVLERSTGTSYPAINSNDLAKLLVKVPTGNEEQQKIGAYFKQLDKTIVLHQQKLKQLSILKKTYLQNMFI